MARDLVSQVITEKGITYRAGESSMFFVDAIQSMYLKQLFERAIWLSEYIGQLDDEEFNQNMKAILNNWVSEFQDEAGTIGGAS